MQRERREYAGRVRRLLCRPYRSWRSAHKRRLQCSALCVLSASARQSLLASETCGLPIGSAALAALSSLPLRPAGQLKLVEAGFVSKKTASAKDSSADEREREQESPWFLRLASFWRQDDERAPSLPLFVGKRLCLCYGGAGGNDKVNIHLLTIGRLTRTSQW